MTDQATLLLLEAAEASGGLQFWALLAEIEQLTGHAGLLFTANHVAAHALVPERRRLRTAIEATCGEVSARKLGKLFARWQGKVIAGLRVDAIGDDSSGKLWRVSRVKPIHATTTNEFAGRIE